MAPCFMTSPARKDAGPLPREAAAPHGTDTPRPRVLVLALSLDVGGAERHLSSVLPELVRRGWPVSIYCTNRLGAFADEVRQGGVEVLGPPRERRPGTQTPLSRFYSTSLAGARLYGLVRRIRPQIAHFFLPEPYLIGAPMALLLRVPVTIMSRRGLNYYQANWPGAAAIERRLHPRMTAVLANSRRVAADLEAEGCDPSQIGLIYNGVAIAGLGDGMDRAAARRRLGLPAEGVLAIVVANLIHYKGHADLLRALAHVSARLPDGFQVLCIGRDEGALVALERQRAALGLDGMVHFLGVRNDVPAFLAASDLSILASHEEGFSNAIIEAMAARLPLVVTDVGGNGEAVLDGVTGFVVPPRSVEPMGEAILRLAIDPALRQRLGEGGRARVVEHFSFPACVDRYERLYLGLLAGKKVSELALSASR